MGNPNLRIATMSPIPSNCRALNKLERVEKNKIS